MKLQIDGGMKRRNQRSKDRNQMVKHYWLYENNFKK